MKRIGLSALWIVLLSFPLWSADHYCSNSGSATWANSTNISTPCSLSTAFSNATAGDTVYLRDGTYSLGAQISTAHNGSSGSRVRFIAYTGETPNLVFSSGVGPGIYVNNTYWTFDGISVHGSNLADECSLIKAGDGNDASNLEVLRCHLHITAYTTSYNGNAGVYLKGYQMANDVLVQYCDLEGPGVTDGANTGLVGVILAGRTTGNNSGLKVLNCTGHGFGAAVMIKHINDDTSLSDGAEIAYNYCYDNGGTNNAGIMLNGKYVNVHDNLLAGDDQILLGVNGGGDEGHHLTINHNTAGGITLSAESGGVTDCTITNNIFAAKTTYGDTQANNTWNYNMYGDDAAIGANDIGATSPTYTGGATPSTIAGFEITSGSANNAASDGKDMGADVTLVGVSPSGSGGTSPAPPTISNVTISNGRVQ